LFLAGSLECLLRDVAGQLRERRGRVETVAQVEPDDIDMSLRIDVQPVDRGRGTTRLVSRIGCVKDTDLFDFVKIWV